MKILLLYDYVPFNGSAVGNIINNIIPYFNEMGHEVYLASTKSSYKDKSIIDYSNIKVFCVNYVLEKYLKKQNVVDRFYYYLYRIKARLVKENKNLLFNKKETKILSKFLKKLLKNNDFDVVMPICASYLWLEALLKYKDETKSNIKVALYQVDPFSENFNKNGVDINLLENYEERFYNNCNVIFTTPIIYNLKKNANKPIDKLVPVELPCITKNDSESKETIKGEIRCVFSGYLYKEIRSPEYILEVFSNFENKNIKLYFVGRGCEDIIKKYQNDNLKDRIITIGQVDSDESLKWINSANVLISIGNLVENQVPSKIFNYFSTGKPIINVCKIENCSSKPYMEKYPLAINVKETNKITKEDCQKIEKFILDNVNKKISFNEVEQIFSDCTPKYIVEKILGVL